MEQQWVLEDVRRIRETQESKGDYAYTFGFRNGKALVSEKGKPIRGSFQGGLLAVSVKKDAKEIWGLIDDKGDFVVKPSAKIKDIGGIHGNKFTYNNGEGWGLMDTKGEILIRAKYESLFYDQDGILIATVKDGDIYEYKFIDEKDNQIGDEAFVRATLFSMYDGEHSLVKPNVYYNNRFATLAY